jgi:hypothetical protein
MRFIIAFALPALALAAAPSPADAQAEDAIVACESQQEIEQVLQSDGDLMPDGCRFLTVTRVDSGAGELCVLDFEDPDPGIVGELTEAVTPTQWWVACAEFEAQ